jgi:hypothetical protein
MSVPGFRDRINTSLFRYCHVLSRSLSRRFSLMSGDPGGGVPPPLTLIYRGLPPIKLLLFRAFPNIVTSFFYIYLKTGEPASARCRS